MIGCPVRMMAEICVCVCAVVVEVTGVFVCVLAAHFCLTNLLLQRHPSLFFNHFVESLFYFNNYEAHPGKLFAYLYMLCHYCFLIDENVYVA